MRNIHLHCCRNSASGNCLFGCKIGFADTEAADTEAADTGVADSEIADTEAADTGVAGSEIAGSEIADTGGVGSENADSEIVDYSFAVSEQLCCSCRKSWLPVAIVPRSKDKTYLFLLFRLL